MLSIIQETLKACLKCGLSKTYSEFPKDKKRGDHLYPYCKDCVNLEGKRIRRNYFSYWEDRDPRDYIKGKKCSRCKQTKSSSEFYISKDRKDGLGTYCIQCHIDYNNKDPKKLIYNKNYTDTHKKEIKDSYLQKKYDITLEDYNKLLKSQNNLCAICKKLPNEISLAVDHDHITNRVRGLLCYKCNSILGYSNESITILEATIDYIKKHLVN